MSPHCKNPRRKYREPTPSSNPYLEDFTRILDSRAFRRLPHKTQVIAIPSASSTYSKLLYKAKDREISIPYNAHIRNRRTHTDEVISVVTKIASRLKLDIHLCHAGSALHDIGQPPFGHQGERILSEIESKKFSHNIFSVILAQKIENLSGMKLNLTYDTLECALYHSRGKQGLYRNPDFCSPESQVVMFADKIAYTFSDLEDISACDYFTKMDITIRPDVASAISRLGPFKRDRIENTVTALVNESQDLGYISFEHSQTAKDFNTLRDFMYREVYSQIDDPKRGDIIKRIYQGLDNSPDFKDINKIILIAMLTDTEAYIIDSMIKKEKIHIEQLKGLSISEYFNKFLLQKPIDYTDPDLKREDFIYT